VCFFFLSSFSSRVAFRDIAFISKNLHTTEPIVPFFKHNFVDEKLQMG